MNRNNLVLFGVIAFFVVGVGLTALFLFRSSTPSTPNGSNPATAPTPSPVKQYVAARNIPPRTVITEEMLVEGEGTPAAGAITDLKQAVGKLTQRPIEKDEVVTATMVGPSVARVVPANFGIPQKALRGVAIWVDPLQTAAGLVDRGDRIDVIAAHRLKIKSISGDSGEQVSSRTIAQDLEVLAVDRSLNASAVPTPAPGAAPGATPPPPPAPTPPPQPGQKTFTRVVVAATPEIAARLVAANLMGELHITIRDPQTRENFPVSETREYPTQTIDPLAQKLREANLQRAIDNARKADDLVWERKKAGSIRIGTPKVPDFNLGTPPMNTGALPTPAPTPDVHEITVVRGTEKTRVVVPR